MSDLLQLLFWFQEVTQGFEKEKLDENITDSIVFHAGTKLETDK
jgi:hypothetical protein